MKNFIPLLFVVVSVSFAICAASGQIATGSPSATAEAGFISPPLQSQPRKIDKKPNDVSASDVQEKTLDV